MGWDWRKAAGGLLLATDPGRMPDGTFRRRFHAYDGNGQLDPAIKGDRALGTQPSKVGAPKGQAGHKNSKDNGNRKDRMSKDEAKRLTPRDLVDKAGGA